MKTLPLTSQAHQQVRGLIVPGDAVIDATAGNGYDTLFLARQTGPTGRVFAFDLQAQAIERTRSRLEEHAAEKQCTLIHGSHECMEEKIPVEYHGKIKVITFNLGYLPGTEKETATRAGSTVSALDQSLKLLCPGGVISLLVYPGHPGGKEEYEAINAWLKKNPRLRQDVFLSVDPDENSPVLMKLTAENA